MTGPDVYVGGMAQTNGWWMELEQGALLVDAPEGVVDWLREHDRKPDLLLLTHQHYDHVQGVGELIAYAGCPVWAWSEYSSGLTLEQMLREAGFPVEVPPYVVDRCLEGETGLEVLGQSFRMAHVPGHSPDSVVFHLPEADLAFVGDTLFAGGVGRTDLPDGSWPLLESGIRQHLFTMPEETRVFPGHGMPTTMGHEKAENPFFSRGF